MNQSIHPCLTEKENQHLLPLEMWGGLECTINRVGDIYRDQFSYTGHYDREDDLELIASLGIKKIRYPILWERHTGESADKNWEWTEKQLKRIYALGMEPIIGFLHHGSGPYFTDLLDPAFPELLAEFAKEVIRRFPFLRLFNPVNEPLTTARFSGQYGFWYPHEKNQRSFVRMLINQCKGIVRCMQEIRKHIPDAQLIQTEDLSKVYSTDPLQYQADFENRRRWFSLDFLTGRITPDTENYGYFKRLGISDDELAFFLHNRSCPDIIGFNYYITSERFLDHRVDEYPNIIPGGNGIDSYVDVEAIRVQMTEPTGLMNLLTEAWERFQIPIAITEVHMGCSREEQMRWIVDVWNDCIALKNSGVDIKAITAWSLFGSFDWNSLLTSDNNHYESGVFDIRAGYPRPTALASLIRDLSENKTFAHPVLQQPGWWKRNIRFHQYQSTEWREIFSSHTNIPILIIGKNGTLANAFARICERRAIPTICLCRDEINILDVDQIIDVFKMIGPWAIINCAGYVDVDKAEVERDICMQLNVDGAVNLAIACKQANIPFMTFSSDLVFSGSKKSPYTETDLVSPLNVYGQSKVLAEKKVMEANPDSLIIRSSAFFGPWDKYNFVYKTIQSFTQKQAVTLPDDIIISPTYVPDLVHASLDLLIDQANGIWHLTNNGSISWADFAQSVAQYTRVHNYTIIRRKQEELDWMALRPTYSAMNTEKGFYLPNLAHALERYFKEAIAV